MKKLVIGVGVLILFCACGGDVDSPPGDPGIFKIYVDEIRLPDFQEVSLTISRIEAHIVSGENDEEGRIVVLEDREGSLRLVGFPGVTPRLFSGIGNVPAGTLQWIRFITPGGKAVVSYREKPVRVPSGEETGIKAIPAPGVKIRIEDQKTTEITIRLDAEHSLLQNEPQGVILKPVINLYGGKISSLVPEFKPGELVVRFYAGTSQETVQDVFDLVGAEVIFNYPGTWHYRIKVTPGSEIEARDILLAQESVKLAYLNWILELAALPNDPGFPFQWGLHNTGQTGGSWDADVDAPEAWDITTGSRNIVVAILDTGIARNLPDLAPNIWVNQDEIPDNGIDDDGNGFMDDRWGWNFVTNNKDTYDIYGHGTGVASIIGATGNNGMDLAGINWQVQMMPVVVAYPDIVLDLGTWVDGIEYAVRNGAHITNSSLSRMLPDLDSEILEDYDDALSQNLLNVVAAGNGSANLPASEGWWAPAEIPRDNIITVAASNHDDRLAWFSNFGQSVHLAAPGEKIPILTHWGFIGEESGTSQACPHVAGAAALILAKYPALIGQPLQIKQRILDNIDKPAGLRGQTKSGGRLNVPKALQ